LAGGAFDGPAEEFSDFSFGAFEIADERHGTNELPVLEEMLAFSEFR
jgi:hypothetical protein